MSHMDEWQHDPVISAGRDKLGELPENFRIYQAGWIGDMRTDACVLKLEGCQFREAKSGQRKGQMVVPIKGTKRESYLSVAEVKAAKEPK